MGSICCCIFGYILLIANISPEAGFAGCFIVAAGLYTAAGTPFSWGPVNNPRYGKRAIASGIQLTIGNASGVAAPFLFDGSYAPRYVPGYAGKSHRHCHGYFYPTHVRYRHPRDAYLCADRLLLHAFLFQEGQQEEAEG